MGINHHVASPASDSALRLTDLFSSMTRPAAIVTAAHGGDIAGCVVGLHTQCSIDPLRVLVCLSKANRTLRIACNASTLAVHYPSEDDLDLAELFGYESGDDIDKFSACAWTLVPDREAVVLDDVKHRWIGHITEEIDLGDHVGFILEPWTVTALGELNQLDVGSLSATEAGHPRHPRLPASSDSGHAGFSVIS